MSILFISDLHLSPDRPELTQLAVKFLQQNAPDITALYILGDLFNAWVADDMVPNEFSPFIEQLYKLKQLGISTYIMVGNRDFMLGQGFAQRSGCQLLRDPTVVDLYGQHVLLMHGDTLCTDDIAYQRYRYWSRNKFLQRCFLCLPMRYRHNISNKIKQKNCEQKQHKSTMIMDVNNFEVSKVLRQYGVEYLIHGHTHRPAIHNLTIYNKSAYRIVLGDWDRKISYLKCNSHKFNLIAYGVGDEQQILKFN